MVSSPPSSPPSRRASQQGGQLLQELEALSQALYQAQRRGIPQPQASPKKSSVTSFLSRRENLPNRRFSSYESNPNKDAAGRSEPIPLPGLANRDAPPPSVSSFLTRRSMSIPQPPSNEREQKQPAGRPRFSASVATQPQQQLGWGDVGEKVDIRSRNDRRLSLQPWQSKGSDNALAEEADWPEENVDFSRKLESSAEKKKSIWSWKPLRALSHIGRQRFHCVFSAYVHAIEGLPPAMNGLRLCVHMRKEETKEGAVQTMPSRAFQGTAEIEETLFMKCTLYGNKGPSHGMKFMSKAFIVSVIAPDVEELDLGKHQLDLSRLLADSMDDKRGELEQGSSWSTTLDLSGKARGGKLVITFDYEILDKDSASSGNASSRFRDSPPHRSSMRTSYSLPNSAHGTPRAMTARSHGNHSPSVSEPGNDYDDLLAMEHLNLDEPSPMAEVSEVKGRQGMEVQGFPAFRSQFERPSLPTHEVFNAFPNFEPKLKSFQQIEPSLSPPTPKQSLENLDTDREAGVAAPANKEDDNSSEDEAEFVVVDKGMEIDESAENALSDGEVGDEAKDAAQNDDLDDLTPQLVQEYEEEEEESEDVHLEPLQDLKEEAENSSMMAQESSLGEHTNSEELQVGEEKTENLKGEDGKETVTYQMVMRTLESLLQGTSAKEQPQEETVEDKPELEQKVDEGGAEEQVIDARGPKEESDAQGRKEESDAQGMEEEAISQGIQEESDVRGIEEESGARVIEVKSDAKAEGGPENLDNEADLVAGEFLHLLESGANALGPNSDSEPDSPRARLLKQFEQEALLEGGFGLDLTLPEMPELQLDDIPDDAQRGGAGSFSGVSASGETGAILTQNITPAWDSEDDKELTSIMEAAESELQRATQSMRSRTRAKMLEDAETEALMQEWGLNEKAFAASPPKHMFKQQEPPPLARGLGATVPVKDGGSLRSMNPLHFPPNKGSGKLVMQVSKAVVVPAEMGSGTVDILRSMASMGVENMAIQAMTAMPLEDVTGQPVEQIAMEGMAAGKAFRNGRALEGSSSGKPLTKGMGWTDKRFGSHASKDKDDEFVSLEDLAPMAMQQIEALAVEGLKIQSDLTEEEAPYALNAFSVEGKGGLEGIDAKRQGSIGTLKGVTGVHLLKGAKPPAGDENSGGGNGLMDMAISLDEWMLLDAGLYDETETNKDTLAIMAAHHAVHKDLVVHGGDEEEKSRGGRKKQGSQTKGPTWGCMGNTLTIAMLVQLRDPLRNNEAVGAPMMAFVQAERMFKPPKPKVGRTVSMKGNSEDEESDSQQEPQFKITGIHMAGLKAPQEDKKPGWGSHKQQQTGSRWLIANGMAKSSKNHPLLKSKPSAAPTSSKVKVKQGESLWSISARVHGSGSKWKEMAKLNPHIRNPDVIYENQTLRTK